MYLMIPIVVFFIVYPDIIVNTLFRDIIALFTGSSGKYTPDMLAATTRSVGLFSWGLLAMSLNLVLSKIFYASSNAKTPLAINTAFFVCTLALYFLSFIPELGLAGVVIADVIAAWVVTAINFTRLTKLLDLKKVFLNIWKKLLIIVIISIIAVFALYPAYYFIYKPESKALLELAYAAAIFGIIGAAYYFGCRQFGIRPGK